MRKIDFMPGYYEWLVLVDDEVVHAFNDFSESFNQEDATEDTAYYLVYDLIDEWSIEERENGGSIPLTEHEMNYLRELMYNVIYNYYL